MSRMPKFEKLMERLQTIAAELEKGDLALEKSVLLYKEGQSLAAACREQLHKARLAVAVRDEAGLSAFPDSPAPYGEEDDDDA